MIWLSLFLSKVLSPFMTEWVFNPGGNHGAIGVEYIENVIGPPGLTAVLFFSAIALLTFISKQTITWVRRIFNPLKSVANKASEIVTDKLNNSGSDADETEADDNNEPLSQTQQFANAVKSDNTKVAKTKEEDNAAPAVIDLTDLSNLGGSTKKKPAANAAEPIAPNVSNPAAINGAPASTLTVEVGKAERASGSDIAKDVFDTPINPLEPFVNYKHPGLELLSKDDNEGRPYVDMEEIKAHNEEIVRVLKSFGIEIREIKATVGPTITLTRLRQPKASVSQRFAVWRMILPYVCLPLACVLLRLYQARELSVLRYLTRSATTCRWRAF